MSRRFAVPRAASRRAGPANNAHRAEDPVLRNQHWLTILTYNVVLEILAEHPDHAEDNLAQLLTFRPDHEPALRLKKLMKEKSF